MKINEKLKLTFAFFVTLLRLMNDVHALSNACTKPGSFLKEQVTKL